MGNKGSQNSQTNTEQPSQKGVQRIAPLSAVPQGKKKPAQQNVVDMRKYYEDRLTQISKEYQARTKELNQLKDVNQIEEAESKIFKYFLDQIKPFQTVSTSPKSNGFRHLAIIGENSAGKSSLFNSILDLKLQVGIDDTTQTFQNVFTDPNSKMIYVDSPGLNQTNSITNGQILKELYKIDYMVIATSTTFKKTIRSIQVVSKINPPKLLLVRNQCDKFEDPIKMTECKQKDRKLLADLGISVQIIYVSAFKGLQFMDNAYFKRFMKGQK